MLRTALRNRFVAKITFFSLSAEGRASPRRGSEVDQQQVRCTTPGNDILRLASSGSAVARLWIPRGSCAPKRSFAKGCAPGVVNAGLQHLDDSLHASAAPPSWSSLVCRLPVWQSLYLGRIAGCRRFVKTRPKELETAPWASTAEHRRLGTSTRTSSRDTSRRTAPST